MKNLIEICRRSLVLSLIIFTISCKPDKEYPEPPVPCTDPENPECPNYDPCFGEVPVTAQFRMYDDIFTFGPNADTWYEDSILKGGSIKFQAIEDSAYYKWYLGQEVVEGYTDSVLTRGINSLQPGTYDAALVVEKNPNLACLPSDDGRDSVYQTFTIVHKCDLLVINKFKGVFASNPQDSVIIEFLYVNPNTKEPDCDSYYLGGINLNGEGDTTLTGNLMGLVNRYIKWIENEFTRPMGEFEVFTDNTCRGEYRLRGEDYVFTGKLLPE